MIKKIISGGQTGADQAALDTAMKFNINHGGWIPKGRITENGVLPGKYQLKEMPTSEYPERTRQNIEDSDGTVIISRGMLTGGSLLTQNLAVKLNKACCHIDLLQIQEFEAAIILNSFITDHHIEVLNVAGPRLSHQPAIYQDVKIILETYLYLRFFDVHEKKLEGFDLDVFVGYDPHFPETISQAVDLMEVQLSLKVKSMIARMESERIDVLYFSMMEGVRSLVGLDSENKKLYENCSNVLDLGYVTNEDAVMVLIKALKKSLELKYGLKVIK